MEDPLSVCDPKRSIVIVKGRSFLRHENTGSVEDTTSRGQGIFERRYSNDDDDFADHPVLKHLRYNQKLQLYEVRFQLPKAFFSFLIGKGGSIRSQIQSQTNSTIIIPRPGAKDQWITVRAACEADVRSAYTRIELKVEDARKSLPYTHFLSLPLNDAAFQDSFKEFQNDVLDYCGDDDGIDCRIFQDPCKLHLTLCMVKLFTPAEFAEAKRIVKGMSQAIYDILGTRTLLVNITGLDIMNDDPSAVHVLYGRVSPAGDTVDKISKIDDLIRDTLRDNNLLTQDQEDLKLKLHVTLMNSGFRGGAESSNDSSGNKSKQQQSRPKRVPFDATRVMSAYGERDFGTFKVPGLHLSIRGERGDDLYYKPLAQVLFP